MGSSLALRKSWWPCDGAPSAPLGELGLLLRECGPWGRGLGVGRSGSTRVPARHAMLCLIVLYYANQCHAMPCRDLYRRVMVCNIVQIDAMLWNVLLSNAT
eukprot:6226318-Pyramimonas_sp.AAC.1